MNRIFKGRTGLIVAVASVLTHPAPNNQRLTGGNLTVRSTFFRGASVTMGGDDVVNESGACLHSLRQRIGHGRSGVPGAPDGQRRRYVIPEFTDPERSSARDAGETTGMDQTRTMSSKVTEATFSVLPKAGRAARYASMKPGKALPRSGIGPLNEGHGQEGSSSGCLAGPRVLPTAV